MGKRDWKKVSKRKSGEDVEPTECELVWECDCFREEMKFYPPIAEKSNSDSKWSYAIDNEDVFGDDNFEGFMGLEVFHGLYCEVV